MKVARAAGLLCVVLTLAVTAFAQTQITTGVIQGTVLDQSGAVMQGASVETKELATNVIKTQPSDSNGRFVFLALSPGRYTVTVSHPGFATLLQENLDLTVGQAINLSFNMKVSGTPQQIVVTETPPVDTTDSESETTLNQTTISNTPILGRKFEDFLTLTPGVAITQGPDGDEINFNGQRGIFNNISLDGGDYNNGFFGEQMGGQRAAIDITLDAVQEFQVVASGASAEFGRTAGGVVNVITKSGTNSLHGSAYEFQRLKALSSDTSDGQPLDGFHREQFGGTIGGPIVKDKMFFFGAFEQIIANLTRKNLSAPIGSAPCPVASPTVQANETLIIDNPDCQRLALVNFMKATRNQVEDLPVHHPIRNSAVLGKFDWNLSPKNKLGISYNFDYSKNEDQTFDVPTYGDSANGTEGPSKIQAINANLFTTLSPTKLNEFHFTYGREVRPRAATASNIPADTGVGFAPSFRFGNPFFLEPTVDETFWRTQLRDNFSIIHGKHDIKFGGEWIHSLNAQTFRGFFTGRYLFDSVNGFLRYASPAGPGGFGPRTLECADPTFTVDTFVTAPTPCPGGTSVVGPLIFYSQDGLPTGLLNIPPGASSITNQDYALFIQDKWQVTRNLTLNYGLRWEAQIFPNTVVPPAQTAYGQYLSDPSFPSDGTEHNQKAEFQPRLGIAWDVRGNQKSVLRASAGIYYAHQNMLSQVGSITTNGVQQFTAFDTSAIFASGGPAPPTWPNAFPAPGGTPGIQPGSGVRVFSKDYHNPRIYTGDFAYEQEIHGSWTGYVDFNWSKGVHLTDFIEAEAAPYFFRGQFFPAGQFPFLSSLFVTESEAKSLYRGMTIGMRKRMSNHWQLEWNYVLSEDLDNDSNERDPFTDRRIDPAFPPASYSFSDRDERHKFNLFSYAELPHGFIFNTRLQAHSPQPITPASCVVPTDTAGCRNSIWKNNEYISWDWRVSRPFRFGDRYALTPTAEMFNTTNYRNLVNPLTGAALFDFSGFLREGVGDPRQLQLALRFTF
ncbi:MAG: TonB-dependent receptor [Terriglobales bacterium]